MAQSCRRQRLAPPSEPWNRSGGITDTSAQPLQIRLLSADEVSGVSAYTRELIVASAREVDLRCGTRFAGECERRIGVSYPAVDASTFQNLDPSWVDDVLGRRGLVRDRYVLYLSRVTRAKGVDDLVDAFRASASGRTCRLVIAGRGPALGDIQEMTKGDHHVLHLADVTDEEKPALMGGCAAFALPSKPAPDFIETFGIALVEKMLAGGGPVITTDTGGIPEAVGDAALRVPVGDIAALAATIDHAVLGMSADDRSALAERALQHALQFDRTTVFDRLFADMTLAAAGRRARGARTPAADGMALPGYVTGCGCPPPRN